MSDIITKQLYHNVLPLWLCPSSPPLKLVTPSKANCGFLFNIIVVAVYKRVSLIRSHPCLHVKNQNNATCKDKKTESLREEGLPPYPLFLIVSPLKYNRLYKRPNILILQCKVTGLLTFGTVNIYLPNEVSVFSGSMKETVTGHVHFLSRR